MIITIDGPSAAGKGTVARLLATRLGLRYVDTGALYRAVAWWVRHQGLNPEDEADLQKAMENIPLKIEWDEQGKMTVTCGSEEITQALRAEEIGMLASKVSASKVVREALWRMQREMARSGNMVFEGRDTGSEVFPDADFRFFITASEEERARRRFLELVNRGIETSLQDVMERMKLRDRQDTSRELAPLRVPEGACVIDTTGLTPEEVVEHMVGVLKARGC